VNSDATENLLVLDGDTVQTIGHVYTRSDIDTLTLDKVGPIFGADFSVAHHESIQVVGSFVQQDATANEVTGRLLSSTDDPVSLDPEFEDGLLEVRLPTVFLPPIAREVPPPDPAPTPVAVLPPPEVPPLLVNAAEPVEEPLTSFSTQSEDYFQLRTVDSGGQPVEGFERIDDAVGWKLLQPQRLKEWVLKAELPTAEGYELWLITTKSRNGEDVTFERPVLKFDIFQDQPFPMEEDLLDDMPELKLERLDVDELGDIIDGDPPAVNNDEDSPTDEPEPDEPQLLIPEDDSSVRVDSASRTMSAAMATIAVSSLQNKRQPKVSEHSSLVSRILNRLSGK